MKFSFTNSDGLGELQLQMKEASLEQNYLEGQDYSFHSIAWNIGKTQKVIIDEITFEFPENSILPLTFNQSFKFENSESIVLWKFDKYFYCVLDLDPEVGCMIGFIFFNTSTMLILLDDEGLKLMHSLRQIFVDEFEKDEIVKGEMLRVLLVRLIITITRLAKKQYITDIEILNEHFILIRKFHVFVEMYFRKEHQIKFYADLLNKSPKTISNYFLKYSKKTPAQVINDRIVTEAKRLLYYTDKSVKEIAYELGFEELSHFSKFFKKNTFHNPSKLKKTI